MRHRGTKPDSLGIQRRKGRPRQLKLFDFSLTDASDRDVKAGTCGYTHRLEAKALFRETHGRGRKAKRISTGSGPGALSEASPMVGEVLLGAGSSLRRTQRAVRSLSEARGHFPERVQPGGTLIIREAGGGMHWWTRGHRVNAALDNVAVPGQRVNDHWIRLREQVTPASWKSCTAGAADRLCLPTVDERAVRLKFAEALPPRLEEATLSARLACLGLRSPCWPDLCGSSRPPANEGTHEYEPSGLRTHTQCLLSTGCNPNQLGSRTARGGMKAPSACSLST